MDRDEKRITDTCGDCGVGEGLLHEYGCDIETCPFCFGQIITCNCNYERLELYNFKNERAHGYLPKIVYENGLDDVLREKWLAILTSKGRIPFNVPRSSNSWSGKFPSPKEALLKIASTRIKKKDFAVKQVPNKKIKDYRPLLLKNFGNFSWRTYPGYTGRNVSTGKKQKAPSFLLARFDISPELIILTKMGERVLDQSIVSIDEFSSLTKGLVRASKNVQKALAGGSNMVEIPEVGLFRRQEIDTLRSQDIRLDFTFFADFIEDLQDVL